ncbi:sensor histidine kinase [Aquimarina sp. 2201CG5-10]|uniref:sensor histidine kinase n=1 Tax=Aquimarina callyspongiae TaxID=3098150 RepID=UPI002AB4BD3B|nr:histidine kinase [Aquimarina sp. 2201CG5-10]MDY8136561.1 histidine kinase [Aquimarina sp. 2201CG5-10]
MMYLKLNKSDYRLLIIYLAIVTLWDIAHFSILGRPLFKYLIDIPLLWIKTIVLIILFRYLIIELLVKNKKYLLFFFTALGSVILVGFGSLLLEFWSGGNPLKISDLSKKLIFKSYYNSAVDLALPLGLLLGKKYYENFIKVNQIAKEQKEMQLKLLRTQFDPHFLFNSLNTLDALIDISPEKAKIYISRLASLYRHITQTKDQEVVPLEEEIKLAENYFFLIETRFGHSYEFILHKNEQPKDKYLPTGALQTVIENVVKHNKPKNDQVIKTEITILDDIIKVKNNKSIIITNNYSSGTGLQNIKKRYILLSNKEVTIEESKNYFAITLPLLTLEQ